MKQKKNKKSVKGLINLLQLRLRALETEKRLYEQNPTLMKNVKIANIELIQNDIEDLKKSLTEILSS